MKLRFSTLCLAATGCILGAKAIGVTITLNDGFPCNAGFARPTGANLDSGHWPNWLQYTEHTSFPTAWPTAPSNSLVSSGQSPEVHASLPAPNPNPQNSFYQDKSIKSIAAIYPIWFQLLSEITGESYFVDVCLPRANDTNSEAEKNAFSVTNASLFGSYITEAQPTLTASFAAHNCGSSSSFPLLSATTQSTNDCFFSTATSAPQANITFTNLAGSLNFNLVKPFNRDAVMRLTFSETTAIERPFSGSAAEFVVSLVAPTPPPLPIQQFGDKWVATADSSDFPCTGTIAPNSIGVPLNNNSIKWQGKNTCADNPSSEGCYFQLTDGDSVFNGKIVDGVTLSGNLDGELNPTKTPGFTHIELDLTNTFVRHFTRVFADNDTAIPTQLVLLWDGEAKSPDPSPKNYDAVCEYGGEYGIWARLYRYFGPNNWRICRVGFFRNANVQNHCLEHAQNLAPIISPVSAPPNP